jgi:hypothetical protein
MRHPVKILLACAAFGVAGLAPAAAQVSIELGGPRYYDTRPRYYDDGPRHRYRYSEPRRHRYGEQRRCPRGYEWRSGTGGCYRL